MGIHRLAAFARIALRGPLHPAPGHVAIKRGFPGRDGAGAVFDEFGKLPGETLHFFLGLCFAMLINDRIKRGVGGLRHVVGVGDDLALAVFADLEGVGAMVVIPETRIRRLCSESGKTHLVILLVELLVHLSGVEAFHIDLQSRLFGLFLQAQHDGRDRARVEGGEREGEFFTLRILQNAVRPGFDETSLTKVLAGFHRIVGPCAQIGIGELAEARHRAVHAGLVTAEVHIDHLLEVHRVVDAKTHIEVVERRLAFVDADAPGDLRVLVVKHVPLDVAVVDLGDFRLVIPIARQTGEVIVELALTKHLEGFVLTGDDLVLQEVAIEDVAVVLQITRPPVPHPAQRDGAAALQQSGIDDISPGHRANAPLIARREVRSEFTVEVTRAGRNHRIPDGVRLGLRNRDREGAVVELGDPGILLRVPVIVPRVLQVRAGHDEEGHEKVLHLDGVSVGESQLVLKAEVHRLAILGDGPLLRQTGNPYILIRMPRDQTNLDVVVMFTPKRVTRIRADFAEGRRESWVPVMEGAALLGAGIAEFRHAGGVFPFQIRREIGRRLPVEEVRLRFPVSLHLLGVVVRRESRVIGVGAGAESGEDRAENKSHQHDSNGAVFLVALCSLLSAHR